MKVVYLGPTESHTLEHGRVYEVLSEEDGWYRIIDKSGEDYLYPKDDFIILEELEWKDRFMNNKVYDRLKYFSDTLLERYEKQFNISLENAIFFNPVNIEQHPEEVEEAIKQLEDSIKTGVPLNEDDIQWYNADVIY